MLKFDQHNPTIKALNPFYSNFTFIYNFSAWKYIYKYYITKYYPHVHESGKFNFCWIKSQGVHSLLPFSDFTMHILISHSLFIGVCYSSLLVIFCFMTKGLENTHDIGFKQTTLGLE